MANDTDRLLWCFIKGDNNALEVTVPINASISRLTDMIWEKRKNGLQGVDAADLLNDPEPIKPLQSLAERIALRDLSQCAIELQDPTNTVLDEFLEEPVAKKVHIVIERCPTVMPAVGHPSQPIEDLTDLERRHAMSVQQGKDALAPSSASKFPAFKNE
ncbi:hypothetical protein PILCRDRAFT_3746 [Piloderma croceum F 1598]|uniref:Crinkler effector protein N-terminal domain-containing protein n=1 Tax=Piloderma croceum (strain F 1598) TaxID=765440 RepID=A0A0C3FUH1_PILCF|nr:hypothetical protein PILCRDRAFT_3746 [Piloderma croceum F 1598]